MFYVGVDPSLTSTGLVVLKAESNIPVFAARIQPEKDMTGLPRVVDLEEAICGNIQEAVNGAALRIAIEDYAYRIQSASLVKLVTLGAILRRSFYQRRWAYADVGIGQVKKFAGIVGKTKPQAAIEKIWGLKIPQADIADAYVLAQVARACAGKGGRLSKAQMEVAMAVKHGAIDAPAAA